MRVTTVSGMHDTYHAAQLLCNSDINEGLTSDLATRWLMAFSYNYGDDDPHTATHVCASVNVVRSSM